MSMRSWRLPCSSGLLMTLSTNSRHSEGVAASTADCEALRRSEKRNERKTDLISSSMRPTHLGEGTERVLRVQLSRSDGSLPERVS
eukprot:scaffold235183_cov30-Tisochrysis_lutea.AAC.3